MARSKSTNNNKTNRKEPVNQHPLAVTARSIANWILDCKAECGVEDINIVSLSMSLSSRVCQLFTWSIS